MLLVPVVHHADLKPFSDLDKYPKIASAYFCKSETVHPIYFRFCQSTSNFDVPEFVLFVSRSHTTLDRTMLYDLS